MGCARSSATNEKKGNFIIGIINVDSGDFDENNEANILSIHLRNLINSKMKILMIRKLN